MKFTLIPETPVTNGQHGEYISPAKFERGAALAAELEDAIDNATDECFMGFLDRLEESGTTLTIAELRVIFRKIYTQVCVIHANITHERKTASKTNSGT